MDNEEVVNNEEVLLEGEESLQEENKPQYVEKSDFDALRQTLETLTETLSKRHEPVTPVKEVAEDTRTPWEIAAQEAEAQSIFSEEWKYQRAMQIQDQQNKAQLKGLEERIVNAFTGMVMPDRTERLIDKLSSGDKDIAAELKRMVEKGVIDYNGLTNDDAAETVVLAAERKVEKAKASGNFPDAAPRGGRGEAIIGARAKLTPEERADLKVAESKYGKFDEEDIVEAYGHHILSRN
jgi:hypothetical protein